MGVLVELLKEASSLELSVVRVSEFVDGLLLVLNPRLWRKFRRDLCGVMVWSKDMEADSGFGMSG